LTPVDKNDCFEKKISLKTIEKYLFYDFLSSFTWRWSYADISVLKKEKKRFLKAHENCSYLIGSQQFTNCRSRDVRLWRPRERNSKTVESGSGEHNPSTFLCTIDMGLN